MRFVIKPSCLVAYQHSKVSSTERLLKSYTAVARECGVSGFKDSQADKVALVKVWLEKAHQGHWLMIIDSADDGDVFTSQQGETFSRQSPLSLPDASRDLSRI